MAKSTAVVVRAFDGEAPYLQSFIDHHIKIGVDQFYFVIAPGGAPLCREILRRNGLDFTEVKGQKVGAVRPLIREDYVAVIDADEYLHPDLISFIQSENFQSLAMPWRLTATLDDQGFEAQRKRFFVFPQIKSVMKTRALTGLGLHRSGTRGDGRRLDLRDGLAFPVQHYYLRGLDDLLLKEGGVVKRTLARSTGRKPIALGGGGPDELLMPSFPSRHARVAFLLEVLKHQPEQDDPYTVSLETEMLQRLHHAMEGDAQRAKAELLESVSSIRAVFDDRSIKAQIREIEGGLVTNPEKISYQKRVLKVLRKDAARAASPSWRSRLRSLMDRWIS